MTQELMSLQSIETLASETSDKWTIAATKRLLETARAAHELQAEIEILSQALRIAKTNCANDLNSLPQYIAKARAEERERCAKICDWQANEPECPERAQYCADAIRNLKDA